MKFSTILLFSVGCFQLTQAKTVRISEGRKRFLRCFSGQVLDIQIATYEGSNFHCGSHYVTVIVQNQCQDKRTCAVHAKDEHYGDSCKLVNEILTIQYRCKTKDKITTSETTKLTTLSMTTTSSHSRSSPTKGTIRDCYYRVGGTIYYNGTTSVTESGRKCQWWDDNEPHIPKHRPKSGGQRNYCRTPDGDSSRPWCYTMDPNKRWEYCNVENCVLIEATKLTTILMTTTSRYSTRWPPKETNDSITDSGGNQTNVSTGESMLTNTSSEGTVTVAILIAGCIFGLLLIGVLTIAIFRRFREKKAEGGVLVLQMNSLSQEMIHQGHSNGHVLMSDTNNQNMPSRYFGNNAYSLQESSTPVFSETTRSKYVDERQHVMDDEEYTVIGLYSSDTLPPSYDSVSRDNISVAQHSMNVYNHAHYSVDDYDKSSSTGLLHQSGNVADEYSKAAELVAESKQRSGKSDPVYENENMNSSQNDRFSKCKSRVKLDNLLSKKKHCNPSEKGKANGDIVNTLNNNREGNQYDDIDFNSSSSKSHYQNVQDDDLEIKKQHQGYMPMEFGKSGSLDETDNVYVPIMSPTCTSPPNVFDDTYQF